jgi:hypothetical protein
VGVAYCKGESGPEMNSQGEHWEVIGSMTVGEVRSTTMGVVRSITTGIILVGGFSD